MDAETGGFISCHVKKMSNDLDIARHCGCGWSQAH